MTRQHFQLIAAALRVARPTSDASHDVVVQWLLDVSYLAGACASSNPRFDERRFMVACGVDQLRGET